MASVRPKLCERDKKKLTDNGKALEAVLELMFSEGKTETAVDKKAYEKYIKRYNSLNVKLQDVARALFTLKIPPFDKNIDAAVARECANFLYEAPLAHGTNVKLATNKDMAAAANTKEATFSNWRLHSKTDKSIAAKGFVFFLETCRPIVMKKEFYDAAEHILEVWNETESDTGSNKPERLSNTDDACFWAEILHTRYGDSDDEADRTAAGAKVRALEGFEKESQRTRPGEGFIYVMQDKPGRFKVGASKDPKFRLKQLQTGNIDLKLRWQEHVSSRMIWREKQVHRGLDKYRILVDGSSATEWYGKGCTLEQIKEIIRRHA